MQTLDIDRPDMPDLQFTLLVTGLCTSRQTSTNIPGHLRTTLFDRCWVLIHETPQPRRLEERVLDLRPWTEVTLDAMVATIRGVFSDAGIRTLTWEPTPNDPILIGTPDGQQTSAHSDLRHLIGELDALMSAVSPALRLCAADLAASGDDTETVAKLLKGAALMQESGSVYLAWARHYAARADGQEVPDDADDQKTC